jgi:hypothetical protein
LDSSVQEALEELLGEVGVAEPKDFIRAIPARRLKTYLGPLLKVVTGHSLEEDNRELWRRVGQFNDSRNKAIHESIDVSYDDAKASIETVRDVFLYLGGIPKREPHEGTVQSVVPNLGLDRLPFLLEYD